MKAKGRGAAATFGLLLVLAGIAGAVALWVMAERRPEQAVDGFARGPVGCTTTLEFTDSGTFYVYEEVVDVASDAFDACPPDATPGEEFGFELLDDGRPLVTRDDTSITYDTADAVGTSLARVEIDEPGRYDLVVEGADPTVVAAVGRDPEVGITDLRRGAIVVGVLGVLLGSLMLLLAGRRSKRAATFSTPDGPGWGPRPTSTQPAAAWPPEPPRVTHQPVDPTVPPARVKPPPASPWAPPRADERKDPPPPA